MNECTRENGGCSHVCENMDGGHVCLCPKGWVLGPDGRTCKEEEKLMCPAMPRPQYGFFKCTKKRIKVILVGGGTCMGRPRTGGRL